MYINYTVIIEKYAERHFISNFKKKYKSAWDATWVGMREEFKRIDALIGQTTIAETISQFGNIKICKTEFRIHNTKESRHSSGNRCVVAVCKDTATVHVLLVYNKTDLDGSNETASWKKIIKENYPEYKDLL